MSFKVNTTSTDAFGVNIQKELLNTKKSLQGLEKDKPKNDQNYPTFYEHLQSAIKDTNKAQVKADKMQTDLVTGKSQNIQETMLAATKAELSFNLMVQIRNKALAAYQEIMRMPV